MDGVVGVEEGAPKAGAAFGKKTSAATRTTKRYRPDGSSEHPYDAIWVYLLSARSGVLLWSSASSNM